MELPQELLKPQRPEKLPNLEQFYGTEHYYKYVGFTKYAFTYTDGVAYVVEQGKAHWLLDVIFSHASAIYANKAIDDDQKSLLVCKLAVGSNNKAIFCMTDGNEKPLAGQEIEFTDFPAQYQEIWVQNGVALLPGEY